MAPLRAKGQNVGTGVGPTPFVTGWAQPPGSGPSWGGESVGGASRNLGLGEGGN